MGLQLATEIGPRRQRHEHAQEDPQVPRGAALVPGRERGLPDVLLPGTHQALLHTARPRPGLLRRPGLSLCFLCLVLSKILKFY